MTPHSIFESHGALAITGQLSPRQTAELLIHCEQCAACRNHLQQLESIHHALLLSSLETCEPTFLPAGALDRFRARAIANNIPLQPSPKPSSFFILAPALAAIMAFAMVLSLPTATTPPQPAVQNAALITSASAQSPVDNASPAATPSVHRHSIHRAPQLLTTTSLTQQATLAPERFQHTASALYPYFTSPSTNPQTAAFPSLSKDQILRLNLFRTQNEVTGQRTFNLAALHLPPSYIDHDHLSALSPQLQRLHFLPAVSQ